VIEKLKAVAEAGVKPTGRKGKSPKRVRRAARPCRGLPVRLRRARLQWRAAS
jgi:hypothetical protein